MNLKSLTQALVGGGKAEGSTETLAGGAGGVLLRHLVVALFAAFGLAQAELQLFLGAPTLAVFAALLIAALCMSVDRAMRDFDARVSWRALALCLGVSLLMLILGGEGRLFYSNYDWRIRDAVLRDLALHDWPFVYERNGANLLLRAPLGMFLTPALVWKPAGPELADFALLAQNALVLALTLAISSAVFATARAKIIALCVFIAFSGLDAIGALIARGQFLDHLEWWSGLQYSSTVTLAFWAPNHALPCWAAAACYAMHRAGKAPLAIALAIAPVVALWSPFALIGIAPFAAYSGLTALAARASFARICARSLLKTYELGRFQRSTGDHLIGKRPERLNLFDVALPALSLFLAAPSLLYLGAAGDSVGMRPATVDPVIYGFVILLEVAVFVVPLAFVARKSAFGWPTLAIIALVLVGAPLLQIGASVDVMMRAGAPAIALLALMTAEALTREARQLLVNAALIGALAIGSLTGAMEMRRAFLHPPSPRGTCSFIKSWELSFPIFPNTSYLAPLEEMPALVRPSEPALSPDLDVEPCWSRDWPKPATR